MEAINGVRSDAEQKQWWYFEVNGYRSNVAAERYLVKHGDRIRWTYLATPRRTSTKPPRGAEVTCSLPCEESSLTRRETRRYLFDCAAPVRVPTSTEEALR